MVLISFPVFLFEFLFCYILERKDKKWFKRDIIVIISFLILFVSISFLVNIGKEMSLPGFRKKLSLSYSPGPGCSKLTTSLVNVSLKFQTLISQKCQNFLLRKLEKLLQCNSFSNFFNKKFQCI